MLSWRFVTAAEYYGASKYNDEYLYFLSDTHEIYKGNTPFSEAVIMISDAGDFDGALAAITNPARRKIYMAETTLEGRIYDGNSWKTIIHPVATTVTESETNPVSGAAVAAYVTAKIAEVTGGTGFVKNVAYDKGSHSLTITGGEGQPTIELDGFGVEMAYDPATGNLQLKDSKGVVLGSTVNLDLERFVSAAAYDNATKQILLAFTDVTKIDVAGTYTYPDTMPAAPTEGTACRAGGTWYIYTDSAWTTIASDNTPLQIEVGDLVDTYTAGNTNSITMSVVGNQFTAEAKIDATTGGNLLSVTKHGLYVAPVDLSHCMQLVDAAVENNIATFGAAGQVKDSGVKVGGGTLAGAPNATTLATEAAVKAAIDAINVTLQASINTKANKVNGTAGDIATLTGDGQLQDSGKKIGGAALADTTDANTLATEAAVEAAINEATADVLRDGDVKNTLESSDTDTTIPSSKAVVDALSWVTTM